MPKILINEKDKTSPGTPSSYANYSVLITGFMGRDPILTAQAEADGTKTLVADPIQPDSNGVYEFNSVQDFIDTIGLKAPEISIEGTSGAEVIYHYGNQMAYELLNMGYSIIYKPIDSVDDLANANTWEIFKDKASYDFRFITHGLLSSSDYNTESYEKKLELVEAAIKALDDIDKEIEVQEEATPDLDIEEAKKEAYDLIKKNYEGFKSQTTGDGKEVYTDYAAARAGTNADKTSLESSINAIIAGKITTTLINDANGCIADLAKYTATGANNTNDMDSREIPGRGDCIALIEIDEKEYLDTAATTKPEELIIDAINEMTQINADNGKYCALTVPSVYYKMAIDSVFGGNKKFPGAFHYLACFINSLKLGFAEWYAAAGYTRGVTSYIVDHTSVKLGEIAINALEPRNYDDPQSDYPKFACNVIANFRGSYYLWGNRTAHPLGKKGNSSTGDLVASSFLNIRQLCTTIKKQLYVACRMFTFDPNSDTLWINFVNAIKPTLEAMKADQGIRDYKILKVFTDKKATLKAKIRIIPIEAVEDFDLEVSLEDSFGETTAVVTE